MEKESESLRAALALFLPEQAMEYFDITAVAAAESEIHLTLTEKNIPPVVEGGAVPVFKEYRDIIVSDFPIRGKQSALTFRRRSWIVPGKRGIIARDIPLVFPGTKLERAFADFLKDRSGDRARLLGVYRPFFPSPAEGV